MPIRSEPRSACPINLSVEVLGDRWSLVVLRDVIFGGRRHFRHLLRSSEEGIAPNVLTDRLRSLVGNGFLTTAADPTHRQRTIYSLTEQSIELIPVLAELGAWGSRHLPVSHEMSVRAIALAEGGPPLWARFMDELRAEHLRGDPPPPGGSVRDELQAAYERAA